VVPVHPGDSADMLAERVLQREHSLLLATLRLAVAGRLAERDGRAWLDGHPLFKPLRLSSADVFIEPPRHP
jgi:phosphoribosylglycinamide formyltransferase-1